MSVALRPTDMAARDLVSRLLGPLYQEALHSPWVGLSAVRAHVGLDGGAVSDECVTDGPSAVLVLGGFLSHPYYYAPFGRMLGAAGHAVAFDDGFNCREFMAHIDDLSKQVDAIVERTGRPIRIVGHSLGGLHALALLARRPDAVGQVVAIATPINGGTPWLPLQRIVEHALGVRARDTRTLRRDIEPFANRVTTISSPGDHIAPPRVCALAGAGNVVLSTITRTDRALASHTGVIFMPTALRVIHRVLLRPCGDLEPVRRAV